MTYTLTRLQKIDERLRQIKTTKDKIWLLYNELRDAIDDEHHMESKYHNLMDLCIDALSGESPLAMKELKRKVEEYDI